MGEFHWSPARYFWCWVCTFRRRLFAIPRKCATRGHSRSWSHPNTCSTATFRHWRLECPWSHWHYHSYWSEDCGQESSRTGFYVLRCPCDLAIYVAIYAFADHELTWRRWKWLQQRWPRSIGCHRFPEHLSSFWCSGRQSDFEYPIVAFVLGCVSGK